jgi:hypothetical protein
MSMNFTEFKRKIGAEPNSQDPEVLKARESGPEFQAAASEAEQFERKLESALWVPEPEGLLDDLQAISDTPTSGAGRRGWLRMAMAASVLIAVGAAGLSWKMNRSWDSVEDYLVDHYRYDGPRMEARVNERAGGRVAAVLADFNVRAEPALADIVSVIKYCPTPDGKGVHMVLHTETGPVTVIYMPGTSVKDREVLAIDDSEAVLVELRSGSAAIIGSGQQNLTSYVSTLQDSIVPTG